MDIFSKDFADHIDERAGGLLAKKDLQEERHELKKTDEDIFNDFLHNVGHPFMSILKRDAAKFAESGRGFVVHKRIAVLTEDEDSEAYVLYYNDGDTWRASANPLIGKYLQEIYPDLYMPGLRLGVKGLQQLLDAYPDRFKSVREALKERAEKSKGVS